MLRNIHRVITDKDVRDGDDVMIGDKYRFTAHCGNSITDKEILDLGITP